jgi:hypothetical protein
VHHGGHISKLLMLKHVARILTSDLQDFFFFFFFFFDGFI